MVSMKLLVPALAVFLIGCSQEKTHAIYDTDSNPNKFPAQAVEIIGQIENGALAGSDAITQAFGDLYTQHSELLDNTEWKAVIDRLGGWFQNLADSLAKQGLGSFTSAAEYYQLSSFGRPDDTLRRRQAAMFGCWLAAVDSQQVNLTNLSSSACTLESILAVSRYFLFRDTLNQHFFETTLGPEIRKNFATTTVLASETTSQLPSADRALLAVAGLAEAADLARLTGFTAVGIDLLAGRVSQLDSATYLAELYFLPHQVVSDTFKVYLRVDSEQRAATSVNIAPQPSTDSWIPDRIAVVARQFSHSGQISEAAVGLCDFAAPQPNFFRPEGFQRDLYPLAAKDIILK